MHSTGRPGPLLAALFFSLAVIFLPASAIMAANRTFTTALFPFHSEEGDPTTLERTVTEMVTSQLRASAHIVLVDSTRLSTLAGESGLDFSSSLSLADQRRIASLAGAEILVSGKTRKIDGEVVVLSRIAGVHTSQSEEVLVSSSLMGRLRPLIARLSEDIIRTIAEEGEELLVEKPPAEIESSFSCDQFSGRSLPLIFADIRESYGGDSNTASSSEAELVRFLETCGFELAKSRREAEVVVFGRAVGRLEGREGESLTSSADVELRAVAPTEGRLLAITRITHTAGDRPASPPGTTAFQEAAAAIAPDFFSRMVDSWTQSGSR
jgi:TolB-like protein